MGICHSREPKSKQGCPSQSPKDLYRPRTFTASRRALSDRGPQVCEFLSTEEAVLGTSSTPQSIQAEIDTSDLSLVASVLIDNRYQVFCEDPIGEGRYGLVYPCQRIEENDTAEVSSPLRAPDGFCAASEKAILAAKVFTKRSLSSAYMGRLREEIDIAMSVSTHPNVVDMYDAIETTDHVYVIMERVNSGDGVSLLNASANRRLPEDRAKHYFKQLVDALKFVHNRHVVHRDLKLDNLLVKEESDEVLLCDFGYALDLDKLLNEKDHVHVTDSGCQIFSPQPGELCEGGSALVTRCSPGTQHNHMISDTFVPRLGGNNTDDRSAVQRMSVDSEYLPSGYESGREGSPEVYARVHLSPDDRNSISQYRIEADCCGTVEYAAPEVVAGGNYDPFALMYGRLVSCYTCLFLADSRLMAMMTMKSWTVSCRIATTHHKEYPRSSRRYFARY